MKPLDLQELDRFVLTDPPFIDDRLSDSLGNAIRYQPDYHYFAKLVRRLKPKCVVELGTGRGRTAAQIMASLPEASTFTTINWPNPPSGDDVGVELAPWRGDDRLTQLLGDTRDPSIVEQVPYDIDLLYIDSGTKHEFVLINAEWSLYRSRLVDGAVVICDDINDYDMRDFWNLLPYDKIEIWYGSAGMFQYRRGGL